MMSRIRAREVVLVGSGALLCMCLFGHAALAQQPSEPPPVVDRSVDVRGVDVVTGLYYAPWPSISIGQPGAGGLTYSFSENSMIHDTLFGALNSSGNDFILTYMGVSSRWTKSGSTYLPADGQGGSLTFSSSTNKYTYTTPEGSIVVISKAFNQSVPSQANEGRVTSVTHPTGEVLTYHYDTESDCVAWHPFTGQCVAYIHVIRIMAISSSLGYRIKYEYDQASYGNPYNPWLFPSRILAINTSVDNCAPLALQCTGLTENWPSLSFSNQTPANYSGTITDNLGQDYVYTATTAGVTSVKLPGSSSADITVTYSSGRVEDLTQAGTTWTYEYADSGSTRTTTVTDPGSDEVVYTSDLSSARVTAYENAVNETTEFQYDSDLRLTQVTRPEGNYVEYTYDGRGNVTEVRKVAKSGSGLSDIVTTFTYPTSCSNPVTCNKPTAITDPRGETTNYTYNGTHGSVTKVELPAVGGVRPTTTYAYSSLSAYSGSVYRPTTIRACATAATCTNSANETKTTISYSSNSRLPSVTTTQAGDGSGQAQTVARTYDHNDDLLTVNGPLSGSADTVYLRYDELRRRVGVIGPDPDGGGSLKHRAQRTTYSAKGLPSAIERGTVNGTSDSHWSAFASLEKRTMSYDSNRRLTKSTLVTGSTIHLVVQQNYDGEGRLQCRAFRMNPSVFSSLPGSCSLSTTGSYGPDRISRTYYDTANRVNEVRTAYGTSALATEKTSYTANGQVAWIEDGEGNRSTYEYDGHDRVAKLRYPHPTTAGASSTTDYHGYTYDAASNATQLRLRDGQTVSLTYDDLNRLELRNPPGSTNDQVFDYDLLGRTTSVSINGHTNSFAYNALGQVTSATSPLGTVSYLYDSGGRRTRVTYPGSFYVQYDYDTTGAMTKVRENGASSGIGVLATYSYDNRGRRTSTTRGNGVTTSYGYDAISRLNSLTQNLAGSSYDQTLTYSRNPAGQITSRTASNDSYAWTNHANQDVADVANGRNQISSSGGVTFSHDGRGNLTSDGSTSYGFDADNRLTSASGGATFRYDALGRLYEAGATGVATARFLYDGVNMIAEYNTSGTLQRRFVHGAGVDEPLVWYEGSGTSDRRWLLSDERGSVTAVANSSGTAIGTNAYDEYGIPDSGNMGRFQYTGQAWVDVPGIYYYKARFYSAEHGRFLQTDPIGYGGGLNLYTYVTSDPVNLVDPSGLHHEGIFPPQPPEEIIVLGEQPPGNCGRDGSACASYYAQAAREAAMQLYGGELPGPVGPSSSSDGSGEEDSSGEEESGFEEDTASCPRSTPRLTSHIGYVAQVGGTIFSVLHGGIGGGYNVINTPTDGPIYLSRQANASIGIGKLALGFSFETRSYDRGRTWISSPNNFVFGTLSFNTGGVTASVTPPQVGSGFTVSADHLENLIIECAR